MEMGVVDLREEARAARREILPAAQGLVVVQDRVALGPVAQALAVRGPEVATVQVREEDGAALREAVVRMAGVRVTGRVALLRAMGLLSRVLAKGS